VIEERAHHAPGRAFRNPWSDGEPPGLRDISVLCSSIGVGVFPTASFAFAYPRVAHNDAATTWIGHSTVLLQLGGLNVLTDPVFSQRAFPVQWLGPRRFMDPGLSLDALPPIDVVLLSHNHYDHLDRRGRSLSATGGKDRRRAGRRTRITAVKKNRPK
jgi:glyoxylase-like metal-dependent hydrolase (beta-lactamase superfamily II)